MKQCFQKKKFGWKAARIIDIANNIIEDYSEQGFTLTLRQLYYQFVARDIIPNNVGEYNKLSATISNGRLAGLIDWDGIEDRTRALKSHDGVWESPADILTSAIKSYRRPYWDTQPYHVEVWVEKEALAGVVESICRPLRVASFACKGYTSQSEMYRAGRRLLEVIRNDKQVKVIHLGDHDPSGMDMTRDIQERLSMFAYPRDCDCDISVNKDQMRAGYICDSCHNWIMDHEDGFHNIDVQRIALNFDQIRKYNPPPNPAKTTDCRFEKYAAEFGVESWELDALEPKVLKDLIETSVMPLISLAKWEEAAEREQQEKEELTRLREQYIATH